MTPPTKPTSPAIGLHPLVIVALWSIPALLSTLETVLFSSIAGHPIAVWRAFVGEAPQWYGWAALAPLIASLGERFPLRAPLRMRNVAVHAAASISTSALVALADVGVNAWIRPSSAPFLRSFESWFLGSLPATTLAYFAIVGVSYALHSAARLRERERQAAAMEDELKTAQLAVLRMQLQPHFLFNSLNAIMALVRDQETTQAIRALSLLGDVLRTAANAGDTPECSLGEELEFVQRYLEIERIRFGDRLRVTVDVPATLLDARVPTFVLQPFVENSLKHGVLRERGGNEIAITAREHGGRLSLVVRDDGRGFGDAPAGSGVGIANARARLERMYGLEASLTAESIAGAAGFRVEIAMPRIGPA